MPPQTRLLIYPPTLSFQRFKNIGGKTAKHPNTPKTTGADHSALNLVVGVPALVASRLHQALNFRSIDLRVEVGG